jgi:hypothetical protein
VGKIIRVDEDVLKNVFEAVAGVTTILQKMQEAEEMRAVSPQELLKRQMNTQAVAFEEMTQIMRQNLEMQAQFMKSSGDVNKSIAKKLSSEDEQVEKETQPPTKKAKAAQCKKAKSTSKKN